MAQFCVNKSEQPNGDYEVHDVSARGTCLPSILNQIDLGFHDDCSSAVRAAGHHFSQVNGCYWCARPCHTG